MFRYQCGYKHMKILCGIQIPRGKEITVDYCYMNTVHIAWHKCSDMFSCQINVETKIQKKKNQKTKQNQTNPKKHKPQTIRQQKTHLRP